jgi:hypothetical protein
LAFLRAKADTRTWTPSGSVGSWRGPDILRRFRLRCLCTSDTAALARKKQPGIRAGATYYRASTQRSRWARIGVSFDTFPARKRREAPASQPGLLALLNKLFAGCHLWPRDYFRQFLPGVEHAGLYHSGRDCENLRAFLPTSRGIHEVDDLAVLAFLYAFDLLELNGTDLRREPGTQGNAGQYPAQRAVRACV